MEEKPNYYAIIPANVRYDERLKDKAKLLYGEINALTGKDGICWASNEYFSKLYGVNQRCISEMISQLVKCDYLERKIIYKNNTKQIDKRVLIPMVKINNTSCANSQEGYSANSQEGYSANSQEGYSANCHRENTSINNTSINNIKENIKRKSFTKPTVDEIQNYCNERKNGINAIAFYDFYESKDWYVGKNKMKDWKACVRTWESRNTKSKQDNPKWLDKTIKKEELAKDELQELEEMMKGFKV